MIVATSFYYEKFSVENFFSKCDQILSFLWIGLHLLNTPLMEKVICCAVLEHPDFILFQLDYK